MHSIRLIQLGVRSLESNGRSLSKSANTTSKVLISDSYIITQYMTLLLWWCMNTHVAFYCCSWLRWSYFQLLYILLMVIWLSDSQTTGQVPSKGHKINVRGSEMINGVGKTRKQSSAAQMCPFCGLFSLNFFYLFGPWTCNKPSIWTNIRESEDFGDFGAADDESRQMLETLEVPIIKCKSGWERKWKVGGSCLSLDYMCTLVSLKNLRNLGVISFFPPSLLPSLPPSLPSFHPLLPSSLPLNLAVMLMTLLSAPAVSHNTTYQHRTGVWVFLNSAATPLSLFTTHTHMLAYTLLLFSTLAGNLCWGPDWKCDVC